MELLESEYHLAEAGDGSLERKDLVWEGYKFIGQVSSFAVF